MLKKLKANKILLKTLALTPAWLFLIYAGFLAIPGDARAANCRVEMSGGVMFETCDGLSVKIEPSKAKVGDKITVTWTITDADLQRRFNSGKTFRVGICEKQVDLPNCTQSRNTQITTKKVEGPVNSVSVNVDVGGVLSEAKTYSIGASVDAGSILTESAETWFGAVSSLVNFTSEPAEATGRPELKLSETSQWISGGVNKRYKVTYLDGGTGKKLTSGTYICNYDPAGASNKSEDLNVTTKEITCVYPYEKKDHTLRVEGVLNDGSTVLISTTVSITGNEQNEGAQVLTGNLNPLPGIFGLLAKIVSFFVFLIQGLVYALFHFLLLPLMGALLNIQPYTDTFVGLIYPGWVIVRNACNILFIISILAIAMGTLLRVDSYQYKHLLVQLILAALLVNFSLVIAQAILAFADTVQNQFLPNSPEVVKSLGQILIMNKNDQRTWESLLVNTGSSFAGLLAPLFDLAMAIGTFMVFAALVAFLAIRIVALWIFLMLSPIAYVAGVLPTTAKYRDEWWSNFIKYAFFTPVIAFFLNIAATFVNLQKENPVLRNISDVVAKDPSLSHSPNVAAFMFNVGSNILLLIFLFAALQVAEQLGIYGGHAISDMGKKGLMAPFAAAGGGLKKLGSYAAYKYNQKTSDLVHGRKVNLAQRALFTALNPMAVVKGWQKHAEELKHAASAEAEAVGLMVAEQTLSPGKAFNRKAIAERAHDSEFLKNYGDLTREEAIDTAYDVYTMKKDINGKAAARAIIEANQKEGWIDDIVMEADENGRGKELIAAMRALKSKYRITDSDFEETEEKEYETETNPNTGKLTYKRDANGQKIQKVDPATGQLVFKRDASGNIIKRRHLKYDVKTRRAMYLAMFGEEVHTEKDENGVEREVVSFKDQAAAKMIADQGEINGKATKHAEYMSDNVYDSKAAHGTGGYSFYDLEFAHEVVDDQGTHQVGADGRALSGRYKGEIILKSHLGAVHARKEVAKWGSREQAGIAHHALMNISDGRLDKEMFQVVSKALSENPGFAQERTANMLLTGFDDPQKLRAIIDEYWRTGKLNVDEAAKQRIRDMASVSPDALKSILARFLNKAKGSEPDSIAHKDPTKRAKGLEIEHFEVSPGNYSTVNLNDLLK